MSNVMDELYGHGARKKELKENLKEKEKSGEIEEVDKLRHEIAKLEMSKKSKIKGAFSYASQNQKKLIIGGLLLFPGTVLLLPLIIIMGYLVKVAGDSVRGKDELPEFDDWASYLFMKGLGHFAILIVYLTLSFISVMLIGGIAREGVSSDNPISYLIGFILLAWILTTMCMMLIAIVRYGDKEYIMAAFEFGEIYRTFKANLRSYEHEMGNILGLGFIINFLAPFGLIFLGAFYFFHGLFATHIFMTKNTPLSHHPPNKK